jgi:acid phosphatase (class A)
MNTRPTARWLRTWLQAMAIALLGVTVAAAQSTDADAAMRAQMLRAGMLPGYLPASALPSGLALLPPPPAVNSEAERRDEEANTSTLASADAARRAIAQRDANTQFPQITHSFACVLGVDIGETSTPALYRIMRRSFADFALATLPVKQQFKRPRPFVANGKPSCAPEDEERLRKDGSYPSGHSAYGFGWGLVLASVSPERTDALIARGIDFGTSREICNLHWRSDVEQGRILAAAVFARLQGESEFRSDAEAARAEVHAARGANSAPPAHCRP